MLEWVSIHDRKAKGRDISRSTTRKRVFGFFFTLRRGVLADDTEFGDKALLDDSFPAPLIVSIGILLCLCVVVCPLFIICPVSVQRFMTNGSLALARIQSFFSMCIILLTQNKTDRCGGHPTDSLNGRTNG